MVGGPELCTQRYQGVLDVVLHVQMSCFLSEGFLRICTTLVPSNGLYWKSVLFAQQVAESNYGVLGVFHQLLLGLVSDILLSFNQSTVRPREILDAPFPPRGTQSRRQSGALRLHLRYILPNLPVDRISTLSRQPTFAPTFVKTAIDA